MLQSLRPYICPFGELLDLVPPGSRMLDAGCGAGQLLLFLASRGMLERGAGFDASAGAINVAGAAARNAGLASVSFEVRSVEVGIPHGAWTVVCAMDVIHHVDPLQQEAFVLDLCRATPPGARLIVKDMVVRPRWRALANRLHDLVMARQWVHHVAPDTVRAWVAADPGLICVLERRTDLLWYGHWTLVFERHAAA